MAHSEPMAQIFGIRHLSPASAFHLQQFIDRVDPTAILIEGPADGSELIPHLINEQTHPPVAILAYTRARPIRSLYYPLAVYSPEWVALRMGMASERHVRFIDLPARVFLMLHQTLEAAATQVIDETEAYLDDPFTQIAQIAGEHDYETWWERNFEQLDDTDAFRAAIYELGQGIRQLRALDSQSPAAQVNRLREAYMRRAISETIAAGHDPSRIVVVCGAYHAPALITALPFMSDTELQSLPQADTSLTLMPYSYYRLSTRSGYGAGNIAPRYYEQLWSSLTEGTRSRQAILYLSEAAARLRAAGNIRSSAEVIEAVRLAFTLASLAPAPAAALCDLRDAARTCLAAGDQTVIAGTLAEIEVGGAIGRVPANITRTSIQDDFYDQVRALKLNDYLQDKTQIVKGHTGKPWLDRRLNRFVKSADIAQRDRRRSIFFHRLALLGVDFATNITSAQDRAESTYKEVWEARWQPECEMNLVENALRGETVEVAAALAIREQLANVTDVAAAALWARAALDCDLEAGVRAAFERAQTLAITEGNFISIAGAVYELAALARYREVTEVDVEPLKPLLSQLFLRATLIVADACRCDEEAARQLSGPMAQLHFVAFLDRDETQDLAIDRWCAALKLITNGQTFNAFLSGLAGALLLERGLIDDEELERCIVRRVSAGMDPAFTAGYFEGLVSRNRMALLAKKCLWQALSDFIDQLDERQFVRALYGLRRAFANFSTGEVRRLVSVLAEIWGEQRAPLAAALETRLDQAELDKLAAELGDLEL